MKKFLCIEIIIAAIYSLFLSNQWSGFGEYLGYVLGSLLFPLILGYLVAVCCTRKSPRIHKIAFVIFCIVIAMAGCQQFYEKQLYETQRSKIENDVNHSFKQVNSVVKDYDSNVTAKQMDKDMQVLSEGIIKTMVQTFLAKAQKVQVPTPMLNDTSFLKSQKSLSAAITKQDLSIKQYNKEIEQIVRDIMQEANKASLDACIEKYSVDSCEKIKSSLKQGLEGAQKQILSSIPVYVDYIQEELNAIRFINAHYNKFTTSGRFPHFTDTKLQNEFMKKIQEVDKKGRAVTEMRNRAWENTSRQTARF